MALPLIFVPFDCYSSIFHHLDREDLKNLRLTCKAIDELVVSPASTLFSRVYVSAHTTDLDVLRAISKSPRTVRCVRELVWGMSSFTRHEFNPGRDELEVPVEYAGMEFCGEDPAKVRECWKAIAVDYDTNKISGLDFKVLLEILPKMPLLTKVTMTELVRRWLECLHDFPGQLNLVSLTLRQF